MSGKRINYGGPMMEHWSHAWLRWMGTVRGLCVWTALMSILVIYQTPLDIESMAGGWVDMLPQLVLLLTVVAIARHLHTRERQREGEAPDASMRMLFETAWILLVVAIIIR